MKTRFEQMSKEMAAARDRLRETIQNLPDSAEGVTMLGSNCCSVPFSLIASRGFNLFPLYWLTKDTKAQLLALIDSNKSADSIMASIDSILKTGKLKGTPATTIPPNVLAALKAAWEA